MRAHSFICRQVSSDDESPARSHNKSPRTRDGRRYVDDEASEDEEEIPNQSLVNGDSDNEQTRRHRSTTLGDSSQSETLSSDSAGDSDHARHAKAQQQSSRAQTAKKEAEEEAAKALDDELFVDDALGGNSSESSSAGQVHASGRDVTITTHVHMTERSNLAFGRLCCLMYGLLASTTGPLRPELLEILTEITSLAVPTGHEVVKLSSIGVLSSSELQAGLHVLFDDLRKSRVFTPEFFRPVKFSYQEEAEAGTKTRTTKTLNLDHDDFRRVLSNFVDQHSHTIAQLTTSLNYKACEIQRGDRPDADIGPIVDAFMSLNLQLGPLSKANINVGCTGDENELMASFASCLPLEWGAFPTHDDAFASLHAVAQICGNTGQRLASSAHQEAHGAAIEAKQRRTQAVAVLLTHELDSLQFELCTYGATWLVEQDPIASAVCAFLLCYALEDDTGTKWNPGLRNLIRKALSGGRSKERHPPLLGPYVDTTWQTREPVRTEDHQSVCDAVEDAVYRTVGELDRMLAEAPGDLEGFDALVFDCVRTCQRLSSDATSNERRSAELMIFSIVVAPIRKSIEADEISITDMEGQLRRKRVSKQLDHERRTKRRVESRQRAAMVVLPKLFQQTTTTSRPVDIPPAAVASPFETPSQPKCVMWTYDPNEELEDDGAAAANEVDQLQFEFDTNTNNDSMHCNPYHSQHAYNGGSEL
jgi:hypothetical protein